MGSENNGADSPPGEWVPVIRPYTGGYNIPYEWREQTCLYWREGWDSPQAFKLADADPAFNVEGLMIRESVAREKWLRAEMETSNWLMLAAGRAQLQGQPVSPLVPFGSPFMARGGPWGLT